ALLKCLRSTQRLLSTALSQPVDFGRFAQVSASKALGWLR
ncbi:hypothetical protein D046_5926B, partial [Vibrio parahaemolyticus V-223/04]